MGGASGITPILLRLFLASDDKLFSLKPTFDWMGLFLICSRDHTNRFGSLAASSAYSSHPPPIHHSAHCATIKAKERVLACLSAACACSLQTLLILVPHLTIPPPARHGLDHRDKSRGRRGTDTTRYYIWYRIYLSLRYRTDRIPLRSDWNWIDLDQPHPHFRSSFHLE